MVLSNELISQFAKLTNDNKPEKKDLPLYGVVHMNDGNISVKLDGSDRATPISKIKDNCNLSTVVVKDGDVVTVEIKNHMAIITGNLTSPSIGDDVINQNNSSYNNILWNGSLHMTEDQSIILSDTIRNQKTGIVLAFSYYNISNAISDDSDWIYFFVPKQHVMSHNNTNVVISDAYLGMKKTLYISDNTISGYIDNSESGSINGISYNNEKFVLRHVIGV